MATATPFATSQLIDPFARELHRCLDGDEEGPSALSPTSSDPVHVVQELMERAVRSGVSDLHFEPHEQGLRVRFRLDGILRVVQDIPLRLRPKSSRASKSWPPWTSPRNGVPRMAGFTLPSLGRWSMCASLLSRPSTAKRSFCVSSISPRSSWTYKSSASTRLDAPFSSRSSVAPTA